MKNGGEIESKIVWNLIFIGIPLVVVGYAAWSLLIGDYRHWGEKLIAIPACAYVIWWVYKTQTSSGVTTDYEEAEAEYWNWLSTGNRTQEEANAKWAALQEFRNEKISNNFLRFR